MEWHDTEALINSKTGDELLFMSFLAYTDYGDGRWDYKIAYWSPHQDCLVTGLDVNPIYPDLIAIINPPK